MQSYTVKSPIKYGGKRREIDEVVEIEARHAKPLLKARIIEPTTAKPTDDGEAERKLREEEAAARAKAKEERGQLMALLDSPIARIVEVIKGRDNQGNPVLTAEHLKTLRDAEGKGNARSTLIAAIDAELAAREVPQS